MLSGVFSYIVPFCNSRRTLRRTLQSIIENKDVQEIILVDDCSSDGGIDTIEDIVHGRDNIVCYRNDVRKGAGVSRNIGAHRAKGEVLVFVDADVVIPPYTSIMLESYFFKGKVCPSPDAVVADRNKEGLSRGLVSLYKNYWTSFNFSKLNGWTYFLNTSLLAIRKNVFIRVGGFLDIRSTEDSELGFRLFRAGYRTYFARELPVAHDKEYTLLTLFMREFISGRDSIKVRLRSRLFHDLVKERKFFAVNSNFIYSMPLAAALVLFIFIYIFSGQHVFLAVLFLLSGGIFLLNAEFLSYAAPAKIIRKAGYFVLLVAQLNVLAGAMAVGIADLAMEWCAGGVSVFGRHARTVIGLFLKGIFPPERVTVFLTERCNLACGHCFLEKGAASLRDELRLQEYESIARGMSGVNYLTLTGGEPFLREDIVDIVRILAQRMRPSTITILTNGYLTDTVVEKVTQMLALYKQPLLIKISMDGPCDVHDRMRGRDGAFQRAYATFLQLKGLKRHYQNLGLGIITTYTCQNKGDIESFYDDVVAVLAPDQYSLILERPRAACELNNTINIEDYVQLLKRVSRRSFSTARGFFCKLRIAYKIRMADKIREIYLRKEYTMDCWAGTLDAVITAEGDVLCCEQRQGHMGNLRAVDYSWEKLWRSIQSRTVRRQVKGGCFCTHECYLPFNLVFNVKEIWGILLILAGLQIRRYCGRTSTGGGT